MKKEIKKMISMMLSLAMVITMSGGYHGKKVKAATKTAVKTQCTTYEGSNVGAQNYYRHTNTMKSYLVAQDDGSFMRVQYGSEMEGLLVEYYDKDYNLTDTKIVDEELPVFGGFYATKDNYYVVTGQINKDEDNDLEVYRITKYDKKWNKIKSTGLKNCNTTYPFEAGSCRMDVSGKYMIIRTCHEMYKTNDGYNHQANVTIQVDIDKMEITDSFTDISDSGDGYVSHSFNQFIKTENGHIIALDHGDSYPRSFVLLKFQTDFTTGKFTPNYETWCEAVPVLKFKGEIGDNTTGASVGGFEISKDHYLVAANSSIQDDNFAKYKIRNVFVAAVDKSTSDVKINYLTNYDEGEETTKTPQLVKISETRFMVLWTKGDQVYTAIVDNNGQKVGEIQHFTGNLSDCQPIVSNGKVVWYTWENGDITFYDVNTTDLSNHKVTEIHNGHQYEYNPNLDTDDTITFSCKKCGDIKTEKKITLTKISWRSSEDKEGWYYYYGSGWHQKTGTSMFSWIKYTPNDVNANTELEITSSDEDIVSIEKYEGLDVKLVANKAGTSTITVKPKYNPKDVHTYKVTVYDPLKIMKFKADTTNPKIGEKVQLSAEAENGSGNLQYKFYEENENGDQTEIQDYSSKSTCEWIPETLGKHTLYVEVKDSEDNIEKKSLENITVTKKQAQIKDIEKTYDYATGAKDQKINLKDYLPSDISNASYEAKIINSSNNIVSEAAKTDTSYSYNVSKDGNIGNQAQIQFTVKSDNYEDITFYVHITLIDRITVTPKEGAEPAIEGSNELYYGQTISDLKLNISKAKFVTSDGTEVSGTLKFNNSDQMPEIGTKTAEYTFIPKDEQYKSYTGSLAINVTKQTPKLEEVNLDAIVYDSQKTLKDIDIDTGVASVTIKGKYQPIYGTWKIVNEAQPVPLGEYKATVQFTPKDTVHYTAQTVEADGRTMILLNADKTEVITGDTISLSVNPSDENLQYQFYTVDDQGQKEIIRDYTKDADYTWKPSKAGTYAIYATAKDAAGNTVTDSWKGIKITQKGEEKPPVKDPESGDQGSNNGDSGSSENGQPTTQKPNINTNSNVSVGVKANQTATANGITYKVTKVENAKNAQVTITSLDKKKSSIVIPDYITVNGVRCKVVTISKKVLYKGTKLKKLTIGKNVQTIEDNAFNGCKNLKSITVKSTVLKKVGKNAIKGIHKKAAIKVPKKQYSKYKKLFGKKSGFKKPMKLKK